MTPADKSALAQATATVMSAISMVGSQSMTLVSAVSTAQDIPDPPTPELLAVTEAAGQLEQAFEKFKDLYKLLTIEPEPESEEEDTHQ